MATFARHGLQVALVVAGGLALFATSARAQLSYANPTDTNGQLAANAGLADIGSGFLQRLSHNAGAGQNGAANANPNGGGAPAPNAAPRYRFWAEGYTLGSRTSAQNNFAGDTRRTYGGVAGLGMNVMPGVNVGVSVDQSRTRIDLPSVLQSATLDLTQVGAFIALERGAWMLSLAGTHGEGRINSERDTGFGNIATASYTGRIDGALMEASYYYGFGQSRIVPKVAVEYVRSVTSALQETGGINNVTAGEGVSERARVLLGAEVGHYFIVQQHVLDVSAYAKFIDNFHQRIGDVQVTPQFGLPIAVAGILESTTGADAGAAISYQLTTSARIYASYDGKFRTGFESHQGTVGLDIRW